MAIKTCYSLIMPELGFNLKIYTSKPVIYKLINSINNKFYIGSTVNFRKRISQHFNNLRKNKHYNSYLQNSFIKYGAEYFYFEILETVEDKNKLFIREQYWIKKLQSNNKNIGYNLIVDGPSPWWGKRSKQHCRNISISLMKRKLTSKHCKNISLSKTGNYPTKIYSKIIQMDKKKNIIAEFKSIKEAAILTHTDYTTICRVISGKRKTANKFIWGMAA